MRRAACSSPIPISTLAEYWFGELDPARESSLEEHLLGCERCSTEALGLAEIAGGIRRLMERGLVRAVVTEAFLERLRAGGLQVREYDVPRGGSVNCTIAPDDDFLVAHLQAPLDTVERLDLVMSGAQGSEVERIADVPFDRRTGSVVVASSTEVIRALAASTSYMRLIAVDREGDRLIGEYTFNHTPWPAR